MSQDAIKYVQRATGEAIQTSLRIRDQKIAEAEARAELWDRLHAADLEAIKRLITPAKASTSFIHYTIEIQKLIALRDTLGEQIRPTAAPDA